MLYINFIFFISLFKRKDQKVKMHAKKKTECEKITLLKQGKDKANESISSVSDNFS